MRTERMPKTSMLMVDKVQMVMHSKPPSSI
jgi:hypothetical protein